VLFCPLPYRVICPLELRPRDAKTVYVQVAGTLDQIEAQPGQQVNKGQKLGQLSNVDLDLQIEDLQGKIAHDKAQRAVLLYQRGTLANEAAALAIMPLEEAIKSATAQLAERTADRERLNLVAPVAGTVLPAPDAPKPPTDDDSRLPTWSGNLLRSENKGAFLKPPAVFCQIGDPREWEAEIVVDQDDVEFVRGGQRVQIKLDLLPYRTFDSTIIDVGPEVEYTSPQLSSKGGGDVMTKSDPTGRDRPIFTSFQARAAIHDESGTLVQGLRGTAKIAAQWQPLGKRLWRFIMRTFNFRL
jgi:putative peptide zinc metalloprotease protein